MKKQTSQGEKKNPKHPKPGEFRDVPEIKTEPLVANSPQPSQPLVTPRTCTGVKKHKSQKYNVLSFIIDTVDMVIILCDSLSTLQHSQLWTAHKSRVFASRKVEWNSTGEEAGGVGRMVLVLRK